MKVAVISKTDRIGGGASRVAEDLATWLNEAGHPTDHFIAIPSHQFVSASNSKPLSFQKSLYGEGISLNLCRKIHALTRRCGFRELLPAEYFINLRHVIDQYDVIHFHDLYYSIAPLTLGLVSTHKPTFFTVHDCSAFTGGCLYPMECQKFIHSCHKCPQLLQNTWNDKLRDQSRLIQSINRLLAKKSKVQYIFPSHWIAQQASLSVDFNLTPKLIPNGLDLQPFATLSKCEAKAKLCISSNQKVVVISAHSLKDFRKGVHHAISALNSVRDLHPLILTVGLNSQDIRENLQDLETKDIGFITNQYQLAEVYSASDILLFCSLADNLPLTVLEAMASSTVVVGFATGGVPEMIRSGETGFLVEPSNQNALNKVLRQALQTDNIEAMGQQARRDIENKFSKALCLERHLKLYQQAILNRKPVSIK
ncbi:MAG: glycosyltransferase [Gloeobacterales cyanobacterium]